MVKLSEFKKSQPKKNNKHFCGENIALNVSWILTESFNEQSLQIREWDVNEKQYRKELIMLLSVRQRNGTRRLPYK